MLLKSVFAIIFLALLLIGAGVNLYLQGDKIMWSATHDLSTEIGQRSRNLQSAAIWNLTGRESAWQAHAAIQNFLGKSEMNDFSVVRADNGRLYRGGWHPMYTDNARDLAEDVVALAEVAITSGARVLYLNTPDTVFSAGEDLPLNLPVRNYNIAEDAFLYTLWQRGIAYVDTRASLAARGLPTSDVVQKTGFLLNGKGAFSIFCDLVSDMEQRFSLSLDADGFYRDAANYDFKVYEQFFMGELGKESGPAFSGLDDYTSVAPAFATDFNFQAIDMLSNYIKLEGPAVQTILNPDALIHSASLYDFYPQSFYRHTNTAWSQTVNKLKPDGLKVLIIHDFYSAQIISHLAPLLGEMHTLAYQENLPMNAAQYIQNNNFDYVIISFFSQNLLRPEIRTLVTDRETIDNVQ